MKKCPWCAEEIQDEAIYCRFCQHDLRTSVTYRPAPVRQRIEEPASDMSISALFVGWIAAEVLSFLSGTVVGSLTSNRTIEVEAGAFLIAWVTGPLAYFFGGVVAAAIAKRDGAKHGFVLGVVGGIASLLLAALVLNTTTMSPATIVLLGLIMIFATLGGGSVGR